ncbi:MAG: DUF2203 domain-containing protein [Gemmatimonadetes bacterium]|nr:MAG: DUF2203 domain-containing protein [Gemmatimonadota bacterium]
MPFPVYYYRGPQVLHPRRSQSHSSPRKAGLHPQWRDLVSQYELLVAQAKPEWGESAEQVQLRSRISDVAREIDRYLAELAQIGCVFKGFDQGLVDFYGKLEGRDIFWCWKAGEDRIEHWHELETGYAGRQPIPEVVNSQ